MQHEPAAELYVYAKELNPNYKAIIERPEWELAANARDWRRYISSHIRHLWPRMAWGEKIGLVRERPANAHGNRQETRAMNDLTPQSPTAAQ
jgi:hypothetical protein